MRAGELDWTDFYKGNVGEPEDPNSRPLGKELNVPTLKKGEVPYRPTNEEIAKTIMHNVPKQPTDEEMFGHLVISEEQVQKAKADWDNKLQGFYDAATTKVNEGNEDVEWANGESFNKSLTEEERLKRNMFTGE